MKKQLIIFGSVFGGFFLILLFLPMAFNGKVDTIVKSETNKKLNATFNYSKLSISLLRNFPKATIELEDLSIVGVGEFAKDTLVSAKSFQVVVNLLSLFGNSGYEVSKVVLDRPVVNAIVAKDGKVNWDIMKPDSTVAKTDTTPSKFHLKLKKLAIDEGRITYNDRKAGQLLTLNKFSGTLSGDMTADVTDIETQMKAEKVSFTMGNIPYLRDANIELEANLNADLKHSKYTLKKNKIKVNDLEASLDGWVAMLPKGYGMDIKLSTPALAFKNILSLVPAIYANDFKSVQADGKVSLEGYAKGQYSDSVMPSFKVALNVINAWFKYPNLPKSVTNINLQLIAENPGNRLDQVQLHVPKFHFEMGGNPFDLSGNFSNLLGNTAFAMKAAGRLDLGGIKDFYPLEAGTGLTGLITANLAASGTMGQVQSGQYENINANGLLQINNMNYKGKDMPAVRIPQAKLQFSPKYAELTNTQIIIGKSDISADGKLENMIPYVLKNQTIKGTLNVSSNNLNLNELMASSTTTTSNKSVQTTAFVVPKNIDFVLNAKAKKVVYNKFDINNLAGQIIVKDGIASMKNVQLGIFDGTITTNGSYSTVDPKKPAVDFDLNIQTASFAKTFVSLDMVQKLVPIFENVKGNYSVKMSLKSLLDDKMNIDYNSLLANGLLQSNNVQVGGVSALNSLATALKNDKLKSFSTKDLKIPFTIAEKAVNVKPFDVKIANYTLNLGGKTGLDKSILYNGKLTLPPGTPSPLGINLSNIPFQILGTFSNPKIKLGTAELGKSIANTALGTAKSAVAPKLDAAKAEAQKKMDQIRADAKAKADAILQAAQTQADNIVNQAKNPFAKIAAKKLADETMKKAQQKANDIIAKGDEEALKLQVSK
ncbi:AsmA-like C-terminal region-containing protein [Paludibacter jiangxiensis]|uniref:AsmA-like C-terminal region protein n=1 Tax=Paludibacter jiangxiensis TaxID=681398 RepID=A0A161LD92_9BACT|nr:AsmA-like C-terminal region-containing protein [Paludibacter jiangxiensis]GAT62075.1 AsmA-like C-terminal region protein [Paludibacter jiangxiensis]